MTIRPPDPPLRHGELTLRRWHTTDVTELVRACGDRDIIRWTPVPAPYTEADAVAFIARSDDLWASGRGVAFAIVGTATGELLGAVQLIRRNARASVGFWLAPDARGSGVATRAVRLVAEWAFRELGVRRLELATDPRNRPSHRVAERVGFTREGIRRRALKFRGERRDSLVFALTRLGA